MDPNIVLIVSIIMGTFTPVLIAWAKQPRFEGTKWNLAIALGVCTVVGTATSFVGGQFTGMEFSWQYAWPIVSTVTAMAFATYQAYWKDSAIEKILSSMGLQKIDEVPIETPVVDDVQGD